MPARETPIEPFVENLKQLLRQGFYTAAIHRFLETTLIAPASLQPYVSYRPDRYTRNLIYKSDDFELLAICWNVGQKAPVHGHEGERCWSRVEKGMLCFTNYREAYKKPLVLERLAEPAYGRRGHLDGPADIHEVENPGSSGELAVSLHLYARPYDQCDIYDLAKGEKRRVKLVYDTMYGKPVVS